MCHRCASAGWCDRSARRFASPAVVNSSRVDMSMRSCGEASGSISTSTSFGTKASPRRGMLMFRRRAWCCGGFRGGSFGVSEACVMVGLMSGGMSLSTTRQASGPRIQLRFSRQTSLTVISRPRISVPIIGAAAAQTIDPMTKPPSGVATGTLVAGGGGGSSAVCPSPGRRAPKTVAIATTAAVATRRMVLPLPARTSRAGHFTRPLEQRHAQNVQMAEQDIR